LQIVLPIRSWSCGQDIFNIHWPMPDNYWPLSGKFPRQHCQTSHKWPQDQLTFPKGSHFFSEIWQSVANFHLPVIPRAHWILWGAVIIGYWLKKTVACKNVTCLNRRNLQMNKILTKQLIIHKTKRGWFYFSCIPCLTMYLVR
jgi:hypothetical protein